ncbi:MAG: hypothetical protein JNJ40_19270 [Bacteroidia bacterium]|nr:hypothetical protein [Bacteroidia bacterium]
MSNINLHNYEAFLIDYLDGNLNEGAVAELKAFVLANPQLEIDLEDLELPSFSEEHLKVDFKNDLKKTGVFVEDEELINYLENNLNEAQRKTFESKLLRDKELDLKLQAYNKTILRAEALVFTDKPSLYKSEDELIINNFTLAYVEGQLSVKDKIQFENELKANSTLQEELTSYQKTKIVADNTIAFEDKEALKKEAKVIALFNFKTVSAIAAAILLVFTLGFVFNYFNAKPVTGNNELAKTEESKNKNSVTNKTNNLSDSTTKLNNTVTENENYIAKNTNTIVKNNINKKDKEVRLNETLTNTVSLNENKQEIETKINKDLNEIKTIASINKTVIDTTQSKMASNSEQPKFFKQNYLITTESDDEYLVASAENTAKKGFWQRAVQLAKKANKLGVKAIDGEETARENYFLSFNSFSVEKK